MRYKANAIDYGERTNFRHSSMLCFFVTEKKLKNVNFSWNSITCTIREVHKNGLRII